MTSNRLNEYKIMWVMVFFDLPTETKTQRKAYTDFRKRLIADGFTMFQFSIYMRSCASMENAQVHVNRISKILPKEGKVCIMTITDRQFRDIKIFEGVDRTKPLTGAVQLELF